MIPFTDYIKPNVYVREVHSSLALEKLQEGFKQNDIWDPDIRCFHALIKYPEWNRQIDLFQFLNKKLIKKLRKNPKFFYLFDASTEGFSTLYGNTPFFDVLYFNCAKYKIPPKKIIFVSSNMVDDENLLRYNHENKLDESINVVCFNNFEQMLFGLKDYTKIRNRYTDADDEVLDKITEKRYLEVLKHTKRFYYGQKYYLSLSRVNRPHRILSAYELFNSSIFDRGIVSHDKFDSKIKIKDILATLPKHCGISELQLLKFSRLLPLIADTEDFKTNHAMNLSSHLHWSTLFQVVGETFTENWLGTSQFWSEKTFRSVYHMQPFVIWGQPNANKNLQKFGYKLYEDTFDYTFDSEKDTVKRWRMLLKVINDTVKYLNKLSTKEHLDWRFKQREILKHNYKVMYRNEHTRNAMTNMAFKIKEIANDT